MDRAASTPFDRVMSASTALVVSAIAGVVLGMALVKMPPPATTDFQGQPAAPVPTTTTTGPVAPAPVIHPRPTKPSRTSSRPTTTTTTTTTTTATTTTTTRPTKPKPPKPTTTGVTTTTGDSQGGLLGPILPIIH